MIIKKAVYKKVKVLQSKCISDEIYGCDNCKEEIKEYPNEDCRLELTVFKQGIDEAQTLHFCSWECVFNHLPKIKTDYFISLPFVYFNIIKTSKGNKSNKRTGYHLIELIKNHKV